MVFAIVQPKHFDLSKPLVSKGRGAGENYVNLAKRRAANWLSEKNHLTATNQSRPGSAGS